MEGMRVKYIQIMSGKMEQFLTILQSMTEEVYRHLGAGFDESIYQSALAFELRQKGFYFQREVNIEIFYKGIPIGLDRPDFIIRPCNIGEVCIEEPIILELKAVERLNDNHRAQLRAYLVSIKHSSDPHLQTCKSGFLINFPKKDGKDPEIELITLSI